MLVIPSLPHLSSQYWCSLAAPPGLLVSDWPPRSRCTSARCWRCGSGCRPPAGPSPSPVAPQATRRPLLWSRQTPPAPPSVTDTKVGIQKDRAERPERQPEFKPFLLWKALLWSTLNKTALHFSYSPSWFQEPLGLRFLLSDGVKQSLTAKT